jgi:hypothetical protein
MRAWINYTNTDLMVARIKLFGCSVSPQIDDDLVIADVIYFLP